MAAFCPKCGNETRSGGKFCGSCGHRLTNHSPQPETHPNPDTDQGAPKPSANITPQRQDEPPPSPAQGEINCPYCEQPIREGVQFCAHCGKKLEGLPDEPSAQQSEIKRKPRGIVIGFLLGVILLMCISLIGIAWGFGWTDLIFTTATPIP